MTIAEFGKDEANSLRKREIRQEAMYCIGLLFIKSILTC